MIERKLTGVVTTININIPFKAFDAFLDQVFNSLEYEDVNMTKMEIATTPGVLAAFEQGLSTLLADVDWDEAADNIDVDDMVEMLFAKQLQASRDHAQELHRIAMQQYEEQMAKEHAIDQAEQEAAELARLQRAHEIALAKVQASAEQLPANENETVIVIKNPFLQKLVKFFTKKGN